MIRSAHVDSFTRDSLPPPAQLPEFLLGPPVPRYPARLNAAVELVDRQVLAGRGDAIALRTDDAACTYRQLQQRVNQIAGVLRNEMGLVPGNRVLLRGPNNPMMAACWLGIVKAGLVAVATMPLLRARELVPVMEKARVNAALCDVRLREEFEIARTQAHCPELGPALWFNDGDGTTPAPGSLDALCLRQPTRFDACDTAADDVAMIAFTSGTTGKPKGTMHFHRDVVACSDLFPVSVMRVARDDIFCGTPPLAFTFGLGGLLCFPLRAGASTLLIERLTPESLLAAIERHRVTCCFTAPTFYRQMAGLAGKYDLSSLRQCVSAGEGLPDATRQLWREATGLEITDGIGSTEMFHMFIGSSGAEVRPGAIGKAVPGYVARVVDESMTPVPPGTVGRLAVKGPTGCKYLADDRQTSYVEDGWNLTGDLFEMDADGYFIYHARSDDMIISAGYNIAGPEVESVLLLHEAVAECGVVGEPDEARGQVVKAYIVLRAGMLERFGGEAALVKALQDYVKTASAPYKYPRRIEFRDMLPRTETGKLQRFRLRLPPSG